MTCSCAVRLACIRCGSPEAVPVRLSAGDATIASGAICDHCRVRGEAVTAMVDAGVPVPFAIRAVDRARECVS